MNENEYYIARKCDVELIFVINRNKRFGKHLADWPTFFFSSFWLVLIAHQKKCKQQQQQKKKNGKVCACEPERAYCDFVRIVCLEICLSKDSLTVFSFWTQYFLSMHSCYNRHIFHPFHFYNLYSNNSSNKMQNMALYILWKHQNSLTSFTHWLSVCHWLSAISR